MTSPAVSADDVAAAREVLRDILPPTPLLHSRVLSERLGGPVFLKCENLQRTGSFKARGGYLRISRLSEEERARGVVAASAGNHAQGVAFAAALLGVKATVIMPEGAQLPKIEATRGYGADIIMRGSTVDDAVEYAREYSAETGAVLIHPFDHPDIVAGQGTLGLEILEQCPQVRTVAIPVGGGGVAAGVTRRDQVRATRRSPWSACRPRRSRPTRAHWRPATRSGCSPPRPWPTASRSACPGTSRSGSSPGSACTC